jgi:uncharacterized protein
MKIAISGASGLIGSALIKRLKSSGHTVVRLVRSNSQAGDNNHVIFWDPEKHDLDPSGLTGCDAVIHLAGENLAGRWTELKKRRVLESRVRGTRLIAEKIAAMTSPPILLTASATGIYGDRGDEILTEESEPGSGFLAEVCKQWESATLVAKEAGVTVKTMRFGVVLSSGGGAFASLIKPFKYGVGGRIGNGRQYMSWVHIDDATGAIEFLLSSNIEGAVNIVSPQSVTNQELTDSLGSLLKRPTFFSVPGAVARLALGEMADELLLSSSRVVPKKLLSGGYTYQFPTLSEALADILM